MNPSDLNALDRTTLRLWRVSNLFGWAMVGGVTGSVLFLLGLRTIVGLVDQMTHGSPNLVPVQVAAASALAGALDGLIVGRRVYRSPGIVAASSMPVPALLMALALPAGEMGAHAIAGVVLLVPVAAAVMVARRAFRGQPRALRAPR